MKGTPYATATLLLGVGIGYVTSIALPLSAPVAAHEAGNEAANGATAATEDSCAALLHAIDHSKARWNSVTGLIKTIQEHTEAINADIEAKTELQKEIKGAGETCGRVSAEIVALQPVLTAIGGDTEATRLVLGATRCEDGDTTCDPGQRLDEQINAITTAMAAEPWNSVIATLQPDVQRLGETLGGMDNFTQALGALASIAERGPDLPAVARMEKRRDERAAGEVLFRPPDTGEAGSPCAGFIGRTRIAGETGAFVDTADILRFNEVTREGQIWCEGRLPSTVRNVDDYKWDDATVVIARREQRFKIELEK